MQFHFSRHFSVIDLLFISLTQLTILVESRKSSNQFMDMHMHQWIWQSMWLP